MYATRVVIPIRVLALLSCVLLAGGNLFSQVMPAPKEMERIDRFKGNWTGDGWYVSGKDSTYLKFNMKGSEIVAGWGVQLTFGGKMKDGKVYAESDIVSYNPEKKNISVYCISNAGEVSRYEGDWADDLKNTLNLTSMGTMDGKETKTQTQIIFVNAKKITWRTVMAIQGGAGPVFEGTLWRK